MRPSLGMCRNVKLLSFLYASHQSQVKKAYCTMHKIPLQIKMHDKVLLKFCIYFSTQIYKWDSLTRLRGQCRKRTFHFSTPKDCPAYRTLPEHVTRRCVGLVVRVPASGSPVTSSNLRLRPPHSVVRGAADHTVILYK